MADRIEKRISEEALGASKRQNGEGNKEPHVTFEQNLPTGGPKKSVGLFSALALSMGTMIGSGIFIAPKGILEGCGSPALTLVIWTLCGTLALCASLVYAELGTMIPESGGEHAYLLYTYQARGDNEKGTSYHGSKGHKSENVSKRRSSNTHATQKEPESRSFRRLPAFLFDMTALFIIRPTKVAIGSLTVGTYCVKPFFWGCALPGFAVNLIALATILFLGFVSCASRTAPYRLQNVLTVVKIGSVTLVIVGGFIKMGKGDFGILAEGFEGSTIDFSKIAFAFYSCLWAFDGWNGVNCITDELDDPGKIIHSAVISITATTTLYIFANIGYFVVMTRHDITMSYAVGVAWGERFLGDYSWLVPVVVVLGTIGSSNGAFIPSQRLCVCASKDGHFPELLSFLHCRKGTKCPAVAFLVTMTIFLILIGDIGILIDLFGFCSWLFYGVTASALLILRWKEPDRERVFKVPWPLAVCVVLASAFLVLIPIVCNPSPRFVLALLFQLIGVLVYIPTVYMGFEPSFMAKMTKKVQLMFHLVHPGKFIGRD